MVIERLGWLIVVLLWFWPITLSVLGLGAFAWLAWFAWRVHSVCGLCGVYG
jgi:hypothetical protein